jgi:hypothetical protein
MRQTKPVKLFRVNSEIEKNNGRRLESSTHTSIPKNSRPLPAVLMVFHGDILVDDEANPITLSQNNNFYPCRLIAPMNYSTTPR